MRRLRDWPRSHWFAMPRRRRRGWLRDQHPRVPCAHCGRRYRTAVPDSVASTQGVGCAACYVDGIVYGHYGSEIADMHKFPVTAPGLPARLDPVCDACIQGWVDAGYAPPPAQWADYRDFDTLEACGA